MLRGGPLCICRGCGVSWVPENVLPLSRLQAAAYTSLGLETKTFPVRAGWRTA